MRGLDFWRHAVRLRRFAFRTFPLILLASCASAPQQQHWPRVTEGLSKPFAPALAGQGDMAIVLIGVKDFMEQSSQAASDATGRDWSSGDATTWGGIMAVIGGIADKIGLRNTGAAIALAGASTSERYLYTRQAVAYEKAAKAFGCLHRQISLVPDGYIAWGMTDTDQAVRKGAAEAVQDAMAEAEAARQQLVTDLRSISSAPPSRTDVLRWADAARGAASAAATAASSVPNTGTTTVPVFSVSSLNAPEAAALAALTPASAAAAATSAASGAKAAPSSPQSPAILSAHVRQLSSSVIQILNAAGTKTVLMRQAAADLQPWEKKQAAARLVLFKTALEGCNKASE